MDEVAATAKVSRTTVFNLENGRTLRGLSYAAIEAVLGWTPGSSHDFLDGGRDPEVRVVVPSVPEPEIRPGTPEETIELVREWATADPDLDDEQRAEILVLVRMTEEKIRARKEKGRRRRA